MAINLLIKHEIELNFICQGLTNKQIAQKLGKSEHTISNHVASILRKLGARNRTEAVALAQKQGMVESREARALAPREMKVLQCLIDGSSNKQIAQKLGKAKKTINNYMISILQKLGAKNRKEAVELALKRGLVGCLREIKKLTFQEMKVLQCLIDGSSNKQIAQKLGNSNYTVSQHVVSILRKLGARNRTEAVALALRFGLIKSPSPEAEVYRRSNGINFYLSLLTKRETEILELIRQGLANKQIASKLNVTVADVERRISSILDKLNAKNRVEAVALTTKVGISYRGEETETLTPRQIKILQNLASGSRIREIAEKQGFSRKIVTSDITSINSKLRANSCAEAVAMALERRLIS